MNTLADTSEPAAPRDGLLVLHKSLLDYLRNAGACGAELTGVSPLTKEAVADKTHTVECVRCGPSGKPAQPGSPWSKGHQHAHALRVVGKEILRDLWVVSMGDLTEIPSDLSPVVLS